MAAPSGQSFLLRQTPPGAPEAYAMTLRLTPEIQDAIVAAHANGLKSALTFLPGNQVSLSVGGISYTLTSLPEDSGGARCDCFGEELPGDAGGSSNRSNSSNNGYNSSAMRTLRQAGVVKLKLQVRRNLDNAEKSRNKERDLEAQNKAKARKTQVIDAGAVDAGGNSLKPGAKKGVAKKGVAAGAAGGKGRAAGATALKTTRRSPAPPALAAARKQTASPAPIPAPATTAASLGATAGKATVAKALSPPAPGGNAASGVPTIAIAAGAGGPSAGPASTAAAAGGGGAGVPPRKQTLAQPQTSVAMLELADNPIVLRRAIIDMLRAKPMSSTRIEVELKGICKGPPPAKKDIERVLKSVATFQAPALYHLKPEVGAERERELEREQHPQPQQQTAGAVAGTGAGAGAQGPRGGAAARSPLVTSSHPSGDKAESATGTAAQQRLTREAEDRLQPGSAHPRHPATPTNGAADASAANATMPGANAGIAGNRTSTVVSPVGRDVAPGRTSISPTPALTPAPTTFALPPGVVPERMDVDGDDSSSVTSSSSGGSSEDDSDDNDDEDGNVHDRHGGGGYVQYHSEGVAGRVGAGQGDATAMTMGRHGGGQQAGSQTGGLHASQSSQSQSQGQPQGLVPGGSVAAAPAGRPPDGDVRKESSVSPEGLLAGGRHIGAEGGPGKDRNRGMERNGQVTAGANRDGDREGKARGAQTATKRSATPTPGGSIGSGEAGLAGGRKIGDGQPGAGTGAGAATKAPGGVAAGGQKGTGVASPLAAAVGAPPASAGAPGAPLVNSSAVAAATAAAAAMKPARAAGGSTPGGGAAAGATGSVAAGSAGAGAGAGGAAKRGPDGGLPMNAKRPKPGEVTLTAGTGTAVGGKGSAGDGRISVDLSALEAPWGESDPSKEFFARFEAGRATLPSRVSSRAEYKQLMEEYNLRYVVYKRINDELRQNAELCMQLEAPLVKSRDGEARASAAAQVKAVWMRREARIKRMEKVFRALDKEIRAMKQLAEDFRRRVLDKRK
eukprot:jgi/Mesvir1/27433/Mv07222-RA.1